MDISQINSGFSEDTEPCDDKLMGLLKQAYAGDILCTMAIADIDLIQPFADYHPKIDERYYNYMKRKFTDKDETPPALFVYFSKGKLIMSDNYVAYWLYKELNYSEAICVVVGDARKIEGVTYQGEPFKLPPPTFEELSE